ncbi:hypothetical protein D187_008430 [Cystobacter fuscus DSM 2262]|uniref:Uncharacterized protein n=1 Tax=Cystobacter fuscus (strain ATCC 25194 / DSM 2262 / NBRC 100088 / M29) TaxID=1242864 RepID=S9R011_CYSF2|nr:hypothetical protein D187_008430 [Cystobacter fuscus DSM 2262]
MGHLRAPGGGRGGGLSGTEVVLGRRVHGRGPVRIRPMIGGIGIVVGLLGMMGPMRGPGVAAGIAGIVVGLLGIGPMRGVGAGRSGGIPDLVGHGHDLEAGVGSATDSEVAVGHTDTSRVPLGLRWGIEQWPCQRSPWDKVPNFLGTISGDTQFTPFPLMTPVTRV